MHYEDVLLNEEVKFRENKGRAMHEGYYMLYICDFEKGSRGLLKAKGLPNNQSICVGKFRDGNMHEFMTDVKLDYVDDINVIFDAGEEFYYFEKPCYVNYKRLSIGDVANFLSTFEVNSETSLKAYKETLEEQFMHAISGYKEMREAIKRHNNSKIKIR